MSTLYKEISKVCEFTGHYLEAECPKCFESFKSDDSGIIGVFICHHINSFPIVDSQMYHTVIHICICIAPIELHTHHY